MSSRLRTADAGEEKGVEDAGEEDGAERRTQEIEA